MKFCKFCGSHLSSATHGGNLTFTCGLCATAYDSEPVDTLRSEVDYNTAESTEKYAVMKDTAAFDTAGNKIAKPCKKPGCGMPYLTHIYVGVGQTSLYVCVCGYNVKSAVYDSV